MLPEMIYSFPGQNTSDVEAEDRICLCLGVWERYYSSDFRFTHGVQRQTRAGSVVKSSAPCVPSPSTLPHRLIVLAQQPGPLTHGCVIAYSQT